MINLHKTLGTQHLTQQVEIVLFFIQGMWPKWQSIYLGNPLCRPTWALAVSITFMAIFFPPSEWVSSHSLPTNAKYLQTCFSLPFPSLKVDLQATEMFLPLHINAFTISHPPSSSPSQDRWRNQGWDGIGMSVEGCCQSAPPFPLSSEKGKTSPVRKPLTSIPADPTRALLLRWKLEEQMWVLGALSMWAIPCGMWGSPSCAPGTWDTWVGWFALIALICLKNGNCRASPLHKDTVRVIQLTHKGLLENCKGRA